MFLSRHLYLCQSKCHSWSHICRMPQWVPFDYVGSFSLAGCLRKFVFVSDVTTLQVEAGWNVPNKGSPPGGMNCICYTDWKQYWQPKMRWMKMYPWLFFQVLSREIFQYTSYMKHYTKLPNYIDSLPLGRCINVFDNQYLTIILQSCLANFLCKYIWIGTNYSYQHWFR